MYREILPITLPVVEPKLLAMLSGVLPYLPQAAIILYNEFALGRESQQFISLLHTDKSNLKGY
ncbi:MAG TPA: hypothetical protein VGK56_06580, partial [Anaerolineales bacterium]